jgi:hypothetical protein
MAGRVPIVEEFFDLADTDEKLRLRIYGPLPDKDTTWVCSVQLSRPFDIDRDVYGAGSLQALVLAMKHLSSMLYGTPAWREGKLRAFGAESSGYLGLPAPTSYLYFAPYPF